MAFKICQTLRTEYLLVEVYGTYEGSSAVDLFPLVLSACRLNSVQKVLMDIRRMAGERTPGEEAVYALNIAEQYAQHLADGGKPLSVAYLGQAHQISPNGPGSMLAEQRQLPFHVTTDFADALSWLGVKDG